MINVKITSVCPRNSGEEFAVTFRITGDEGQSDCKCLTISSDQYLALSPRVGQSDADKFDLFLHEAEVYSALKKGIFLLNYGTCSKKRLCEKLCAKGFERSVAAEAVKIIETKGLMDPYSDAIREAEKCFAKLLGKRRIASELFSKGYDDESVRNALCILEDNGADFEKSCLTCIEKKFKAPPTTAAELKKIYSFLLSRGFSSCEIKSALSAAFKNN